MKMDPGVNELLIKMQKMTELELTTKVIIPLFEVDGFFKVEYNGGRSEEGKDILCWNQISFGEIELSIVQVKRYKPSGSASSTKSFETIVNQLINSFSKRVQFTDKTVHIPSRAYLITPFPVETSTLQKRFDDNPSLKEQQITIIDGYRLINELRKKKPKIIDELFGIHLNISSNIRTSLNNNTLLSLIGYSGVKELHTIYTDIDISIGKPTTQLFFKSNLNPQKVTEQLFPIEFEEFERVLYRISNTFSKEFLVNDIESIRLNYSERKEELIKKLDSIKKKTHANYKALNWIKKSPDKKNKYSKEERAKALEAEKKKPSLANKAYDWIEGNINKKIGIIESEIERLRYEITIDGKILSDQIVSKREYIEDQIKEFNSNFPNSPKLKLFVQEYNYLIDVINVVFNSQPLLNSFNIDTSIQRRTEFESTRLKLPVDLIFDTGLNVSLLGEAGAGKSTNLQMYTLNKLDENPNKLFIYASLSSFISNWFIKDPRIKDHEEARSLEFGIAYYISLLGNTIEPKEFCEDLNNKGGTLLLDGIDEVIKSAPWLINSIINFASRYQNNLQVIISSRVSGSYLNQIPFFAATLLPFTEEQRSLFILKWYDNNSHNKHYLTIIEHLKKNLQIAEIVNNPLNATILCALAENNTNLPITEIQLYEQRFKLLIGSYDIAKGVSRRIKSNYGVLEILSRKLAFQFHLNGIREDSIDGLIKIASEIMADEMDNKRIILAVNELIDPCNVLISMSHDGKYGFGHLRFQEYLAATEIYHNREIEILELIVQPAWHDVLLLHASMYKRLNWLFNHIVQTDSKYIADNGLLSKIIESRPKEEQEQLISLLNKKSNLIKYKNLSEKLLNI